MLFSDRGTMSYRSGQVRFWVVLASLALFLCGFMLRVAGAWWYAYSPNPDYAVVVQMARHIAAGIDFPVFFYGQAYMGSLEPLASAVLVFFFGPSPFFVCLGTALVSFLLLGVVFRVALKISGFLAAFVATSFCLMGPMGYFHYMCSPRGGYAVGLLLTMILIQMSVFVGEAKANEWKRELKEYFVLGLVCGLGFWNFWLVMPAIGVVGIMLIFRLRFRLFRWRVWVPGLTGFLTGSLPWWIWNIRQGWDSLATSSSCVDVRMYSEAAKAMFIDRIPSLIGFSVVKSHSVQMLVFALIILLALVPLVLTFLKRQALEPSPFKRLSAVVMIYVALFTIAFATSAFASIKSPRYMLPLVPVFAVWVGCGIGEVYSRMKSALNVRVRFSLRIVWLVLMLAVGFLVALTFMTLKVHRQHPRDWYGQARELMTHLGAQEAVFADFVLFGVNWATDEEVCAVSPRLWRYLPYALRLEYATSPGVLENMGGFDEFLKSTASRADYARCGGYRLHVNAQAPLNDFGILAASEIISILDDKGGEWRDELVDANGQTCAYLTQAGGVRETTLTVRFREPVKISGVRAVTREQGVISAWSVSGRNDTDSDFADLSALLKHSGFFWSGPRFYSGGINHRVEKFFAATEVTELRIYIPVHWSSSGVSLETVQFLVEKAPRTGKDFEAVCAMLNTAKIQRVFADRWAANRIHEITEGAIWTLREPALTSEDPEWATRIPLESSSAIVVIESDAEHTQAVLSTAGVDSHETKVGGMAVFIPTRKRTGADEPELYFYAGQLFNNILPLSSRMQIPIGAKYSGGKLVLEGHSEWKLWDSGERKMFVALDWRTAPAFTLPKNTFIFLHCLDKEGKIVFQLDEKLLLDPCSFGSREGKVMTTVHQIPIPASVPDGEYTVLLGVLKPGLFPKRLVPETAREVDDNRVVLPARIHIGLGSNDGENRTRTNVGERGFSISSSQ